MIPQVLRQHKRVLIDTGVWIHRFEQRPEFGRAAGIAIQSLEDGRFRGVASELTLLELTVRPLQLGRQDVADEYELLLSYFPNLDLESLSAKRSYLAPPHCVPDIGCAPATQSFWPPG